MKTYSMVIYDPYNSNTIPRIYIIPEEEISPLHEKLLKRANNKYRGVTKRSEPTILNTLLDDMDEDCARTASLILSYPKYASIIKHGVWAKYLGYNPDPNGQIKDIYRRGGYSF